MNNIHCSSDLLLFEWDGFVSSDIPELPQDVEAHAVSARIIEVNWKPPTRDEKHIKFYRIYLSERYSPQKVSNLLRDLSIIAAFCSWRISTFNESFIYHPSYVYTHAAYVCVQI